MDSLKNKLPLILSLFGVMTGIVALVTYFHNKKHQKIKDELLFMDHELKTLQLEKAKNGMV